MPCIAFKGAGDLVDRLKNEDLRAKKKEWLASRCDELLLKAAAPGLFGALLKAGVLDLAMDVLSNWKLDGDIVLIIFKLLLALLQTDGVSEEILECGGDDTIVGIQNELYEDKEIRSIGKLLVNNISDKGSTVGRDWIQRLKQHLIYGVPLLAVDEMLSAADEKKGSARVFPTSKSGGECDDKEGSSSEVIDKLIFIMNKYKDVESLQLDGIEVFIELAKKNSGVNDLIKYNGFVAITSVMSHTKSEGVLCRCCIAISELGSELFACIELARCGVCPILMSMFRLSTHEYRRGDVPTYSDAVRQFGLFAISVLCRDSTYCVPTFEALDIKILLFDLLVSRQGYGHTRDVVVPLRLRGLYSQEALQEAKRYWTGPKQVPPSNQPKVRGIPRPPVIPMHGTVGDYFSDPGAPGLI